MQPMGSQRVGQKLSVFEILLCVRASHVAQWLRICLPMKETQETWVQSLGQEDPLEEEMTTVFLPGQSDGQRSLAGYSPWGGKELDTTEHTQNSVYAICYRNPK